MLSAAIKMAYLAIHPLGEEVVVVADWHWAVSNQGPRTLLVWLEPWGEEFEVPIRSSLTMKVMNDRPEGGTIEVENGDDHVVVWAHAGNKIAIYIDDVFQDSGSAIIQVPDAFGESTKKFLSIAFDKQPEARLGGSGSNAPPRTSLWRKLKRALRISS